MGRTDVAERIASFDASAWQALCILHVLADDGVVSEEKDELAQIIGVSRATLQRRLNALEKEGYVTFDSAGRVAVNHVAQGLTQFCTDVINVYTNVSLKDNKNTSAQICITDSDVIKRWSERYKAKYGVSYNYGKFPVAKASAKKFARRFGNDSLAIIDVVFDNYDSVWRSANYARPTFGALVTWLGEQAVGYVEKRSDTKEGVADVDVREWI